MGKTMPISAPPKITDQLAELDSLKAKVAEIEKKTAIVKPYQDILDRAYSLILKLNQAIKECPTLDEVNWDASGEDLEPVKEKFRAVENLLPLVKPAKVKKVSQKDSWLTELETVPNKKATFDEWSGIHMGEGKTFQRLSGSARKEFETVWERISKISPNPNQIEVIPQTDCTPIPE
jgi:hypothetical protein